MSSSWKIYWTDPFGDESRWQPMTGSWAEIREREHRLAIPSVHPILVSPELKIDPRLSDFFRRSRFAGLALGTRKSYATDYRLFFSFLAARGVDWNHVSEDDIRDWHHWRRIDPKSPRRVGGSKWNRELAALRLLYRWAYLRGHVSAPLHVLTELTAADARTTNVKWLTRRAYIQWRDVGLRGYGPSGLRDATFRGRQTDRNVAFADLLFSSGMRLREAGSLLVAELPQAEVGRRYARLRIGDAVAKARGYFAYGTATAFESVRTYVQTNRAECVRHAQRTGMYSRVRGMLIVDLITSNGQLRWHDEDGVAGAIHINHADSELRARLFTRTPSGLEPLALWLDQTGMPLSYESWKKIFRQAGDRCARHEVSLRCTPHMLRHSFALHMLVSLEYAFDRRLGLTPSERRYYQDVYGRVWDLVSDMLGHSDEKITKEVYLEPVRGLQLDFILNDSGDEDVDALLTMIARTSGLVADAQ